MSQLNCCVYGCNSVKRKHKNLHFHRFPPKGKHTAKLINKFHEIEKVDVRKAWILLLKIGKPVNKFMKVCSKHFTALDHLPMKEGM